MNIYIYIYMYNYKYITISRQCIWPRSMTLHPISVGASDASASYSKRTSTLELTRAQSPWLSILNSMELYGKNRDHMI